MVEDFLIIFTKDFKFIDSLILSLQLFSINIVFLGFASCFGWLVCKFVLSRFINLIFLLLICVKSSGCKNKIYFVIISFQLYEDFNFIPTYNENFTAFNDILIHF